MFIQLVLTPSGKMTEHAADVTGGSILPVSSAGRVFEQETAHFYSSWAYVGGFTFQRAFFCKQPGYVFQSAYTLLLSQFIRL